MRPMRKWTNRRQWCVWIACWAILFNTLVPTLSYAFSAANGNSVLQEICSASGAKYASVGAADAIKMPGGASLHHLDHCPYCLSDGSAPALPTTLPAAPAVAETGAYYPPLFYTAPAPLFSWSASKPRGPPSLS